MNQILILDFGSQYTQLIARRLRQLKVYCEILPCSTSLKKIASKNLKGIILSGGPSSIYDKDSPKTDTKIFELGVPILGICYGMQLISHEYHGEVIKSKKREYGFSLLKTSRLCSRHAAGSQGAMPNKRPKTSRLFEGIPKEIKVWMSHGDEVKKMPNGFKNLASTPDTKIAAIENKQKNIYALQFHPEVHHADYGLKILKNFAHKICLYKDSWSPASFLNETIADIKKEVKNNSVICGLSGGVDSSVAAVIVNKAIGNKLYCIFVDTGLLRAGDKERMRAVFNKKYKFNLKIADASQLFLSRLKGVSSPERKRKIIGKTFIEVFEKESKKIKNAGFLVQGTLYPDIIESVSVKGPSAVIKSHHNVGGLPKKMNLKLIEPLKFLFKDEVRVLGRSLKMPEEILMQHPFPGPGLAIRIIGDVTEERINILKKADKIMRAEIKKFGWQDKIWQAFCVLLPVKSVGVMGDERSYENTIAVRCVESVDGMTADWSKLPYELMQKISSRIVSEVKGINRIVYDITSKPPSTIEWE
ncbi:MAG: glutamine-hydrolyzing GMP synthase [Elusimicrobia bacterium]|nr:glutamine-hydrolyzing GMP synthase [Elusimicrobiota bacterium]